MNCSTLRKPMYVASKKVASCPRRAMTRGDAEEAGVRERRGEAPYGVVPEARARDCQAEQHGERRNGRRGQEALHVLLRARDPEAVHDDGREHHVHQDVSQVAAANVAYAAAAVEPEADPHEEEHDEYLGGEHDDG
ncbi:hypothetical protein [Olsenella phocaeensis]|uniref:hypothetical protein n=1 Tax=Olsenella phocaeensis TaxID=1852385 RepID=UPI00101AD48F|nr:hypothetical protein [Olsenella phocaeensis]